MKQTYINAMRQLINAKKAKGHKSVLRTELNIAVVTMTGDGEPNGKLVTECINELASTFGTVYDTNGKKAKLYI